MLGKWFTSSCTNENVLLATQALQDSHFGNEVVSRDEDSKAQVKTRTLRKPKGSGTPRVSIVLRRSPVPRGRVGHPPISDGRSRELALYGFGRGQQLPCDRYQFPEFDL